MGSGQKASTVEAGGEAAPWGGVTAEGPSCGRQSEDSPGGPWAARQKGRDLHTSDNQGITFADGWVIECPKHGDVRSKRLAPPHTHTSCMSGVSDFSNGCMETPELKEWHHL